MCREDTLYGDNDKVRQMYSAKYSFLEMTSNLNANQAGGCLGKGV